MVPAVVAPDPRAHALRLDLLREPEEVVPPQLALADDRQLERALVSGRLLVVAEVEETRRLAVHAEDVDHVLDHIGAHLVVLLRGHHPLVVLQPRVVAGGEVHLGDDLQPHRAQAGQLLLELLDAPRALHGELGVAGQVHALRHVDDEHVRARFPERVGERAPHGLVGAQVVGHAAHLERARRVGRRAVERDVLPGVHAEVEEA